jgi:hypothetical protein
MTTIDPVVRAELEAIRARIDAILTPAVSTVESKPDEPRRMRVGAYASARGYAPRTVTRWCAAGMPHVGKRQSRRILVAEADAWIADGGPDRAAGAARAAGRTAAAIAAMQ